MNEFQALSFDDILLRPAPFSNVRSRKDVDTSEKLCDRNYKLPIIASNMDAVYSPKLAKEVAKGGGISITHRFCSIEENIRSFQNGIFSPIQGEMVKPWVSVGVSEEEADRAEALVCSGAEVILIDVALGASIHVVEQYNKLRELFRDNVYIAVGNFATSEQITAFVSRCKRIPDLFKLNIGSGSACSTRIVTGVGLPSVTTILECVKTGYPIIQDGGIKNSGDLCKALALGCKGAIVGRLFSQCEESGAETIYDNYNPSSLINPTGKKRYRGSASASSYKTQNKTDSHRAPEGEEYTVPIIGKVENLMQKMEGGLRSSMSYLGAFTLEEYRKNANWVVVTNNGAKESSAYGAKENG